MVWGPLDLNDIDVPTPGLLRIPPGDLLSPITRTASFLHRLDYPNLSQASIISLNIIYLLAALSVIPTVNYLLSAACAWSQSSLATSHLLQAVLDPICLLCILRPTSIPKASRSRLPVRRRRIVVVCSIALAVMGLEMVFIVGQASRPSQASIPFSQIRVKIARQTDLYLDRLPFVIGWKGSLYAIARLFVPGVSSVPILTISQGFNSAFALSHRLSADERAPARDNANFLIRTDGPRPEFSVYPLAPLLEPIRPLKHTFQASVRGLGRDDVMVSFRWITIDRVKETIIAVAQATQTEECKWTVVPIGESGSAFSAYAAEQDCYKTITSDLQDDIVTLIGRLLLARLRIGSFPEQDSLALVTGAGISVEEAASRDGEQGADAFILDTTQQIVPNLVLLLLSCALISITLVRSCLCLKSVTPFADRDFLVVAKAFGWDESSDFSRVDADASLSSLPVLKSGKEFGHFGYSHGVDAAQGLHCAQNQIY